jgi:tetratricopeptide (TPR) repeat protein
MARREARRARLLGSHRRPADQAALIVFGFALLQALVALALLGGWWAAALLLHLGCCALLPLLRRLSPQRGSWAGSVLAVMAAALPALGPLAAAAGLLALLVGAPRGFDSAAEALPEDPMEARLAAIAAAPDSPVAPLPSGLMLEALGDVLRWGTGPQKARALSLATRGGHRGGDALLHLALLDTDGAVRARAEMLRPDAERRLLAEVESLRAAARGPQQDGTRMLARQLDRAAFSGLLETDRAALCRAEAAGLWLAIVEQSPDDAEARAALGRDLMMLGDLPAASAALEAALAHGVATAGVVGWLAECLFRARDFAALEALVARWRPLLEEEARGASPLAPAWRLWLREAR